MESAARSLLSRLQSVAGAALDDVLRDIASESYFVDFKNSTPGSNPRTASDKDRNIMAKAISGFGNSEGGLLIWGIDHREDRATGQTVTTLVGVEDAVTLASQLEAKVATATIPLHTSVSNCVIGPNSDGKNFVVTYVPRSPMAPLQVIPDLKYYIRAGSDFVPAPHAVLAGMFGQTPQPLVQPMFRFNKLKRDGTRFRVDCTLGVQNISSVTAKGAYVTVRFPPRAREEFALQLVVADAGRMHVEISGETEGTAIVHHDRALPPTGRLDALRIILHLKAGSSGLSASLLAGADGRPPIVVEACWDSTFLDELHRAYSAALPSGGASPEQGSELVGMFWKPVHDALAQQL